MYLRFCAEGLFERPSFKFGQHTSRSFLVYKSFTVQKRGLQLQGGGVFCKCAPRKSIIMGVVNSSKCVEYGSARLTK